MRFTQHQLAKPMWHRMQKKRRFSLADVSSALVHSIQHQKHSKLNCLVFYKFCNMTHAVYLIFMNKLRCTDTACSDAWNQRKNYHVNKNTATAWRCRQSYSLIMSQLLSCLPPSSLLFSLLFCLLMACPGDVTVKTVTQWIRGIENLWHHQGVLPCSGDTIEGQVIGTVLLKYLPLVFTSNCYCETAQISFSVKVTEAVDNWVESRGCLVCVPVADQKVETWVVAGEMPS